MTVQKARFVKVWLRRIQYLLMLAVPSLSVKFSTIRTLIGLKALMACQCTVSNYAQIAHCNKMKITGYKVSA